MITALISSLFLSVLAFENTQDSVQMITLDEVNIVSNVKEMGSMRQQPASSTHISAALFNQKGGDGLKDLGTLAPNFFVPDYGSKQSSALYMRGIGSRIGTSSVGLYVDNVACYDKTAFDFSFNDIERIDVLRGPQNTLYGRNAMSGLVRMHSKNPFYHTGTDIRLGYATAEQRRQVALTHYHRESDKLAFSVGGFYNGGDGFFRNDFTQKMIDASSSAGARLRAIYKASERLSFDGIVSYEYSDEGAYPYFYTGATTGEEAYAFAKGRIMQNLESRYRRNLFNTSLNAEYKTNAVTFNSVTAYQHISDGMFMDQDFLCDDIYSLEQRQEIHNLSEEIVIKNNGRKKWNWISGANVFYQWQNIEAPVSFRKDGVAWLNSLINTNANKYMPPVTAGPMTMNFLFADNIVGNMLQFQDDFDTPVLGAALFHQSTLNDLFGIDGLSVALGLRLDYEKMKMDYRAWYDFEHIYGLKGVLSPMNKEVEMVKEQVYRVNSIALDGSVSNDYLRLLPKLSLKYEFSNGNVYGTVSYGYRSGGYNPQNVSELLRPQMQADMMSQVRDVTIPVLEQQPMVPADKKETIKGILNGMAMSKPANVEEYCSYKPEFAWNYEIGTHLDFFDKALGVDFSAFLINVSDLQLSQMSETGLGRTIVNAGRSRSMGLELAFRAHPVNGLSIGAAYGLSNATFRKYETYDDASRATVDCKGNKVPYVPSNTLNADVNYTLELNNSLLQSLTFGVDCSYVGKIYWDELNAFSQKSYALLGAHVQFAFQKLSLQLWGRNLTNEKYNTFWFESRGNGFEQHGKPLQFGATLSMHL